MNTPVAEPIRIAPGRRRLAIIENNCISNDPCALCGERCDPTGLDLVLVEESRAGNTLTGALVCDPCGWRHAPELQRIRRDAALLAGHLHTAGHAHLDACCFCGCPGPCRVHDAEADGESDPALPSRRETWAL